MRQILSRGAPPTAEENKLDELCAERARLTVKLTNLKTRRRMLRKAIHSDGEITMGRAKAERQAQSELRGIEPEIKRVGEALDNVNREVEEKRKEIEKASVSRGREDFYSWHERAVALIAVHKYLDPDSDHVASPHGSTITTDELQKQLRAEGFQVGARELRRFMRRCGVAGKRGKRTDLKKTSAETASRNQPRAHLPCETEEKRRLRAARIVSSEPNTPEARARIARAGNVNRTSA